MNRLSHKGSVAVLAVLGAAGLLISGFRPWVTGAVNDAVLGASTISATGAEVAPGLSAVALAIAAAAIAVIAAGRIAGVVATIGYAACLLLAAGLTVRVLVDPSGALGPVAASRVGRTGSVATVAHPTVWPWVAALAIVVGALGLVGALVGRRRWAGPTSRYEVPRPQDGHVAGARGERVGSDWDELSAGRDPTDEGTGSAT
ncbi:MAG: Trp biosynthesis-associated membrane protein [Ornithinibacter sp.]